FATPRNLGSSTAVPAKKSRVTSTLVKPGQRSQERLRPSGARALGRTGSRRAAADASSLHEGHPAGKAAQAERAPEAVRRGALGSPTLAIRRRPGGGAARRARAGQRQQGRIGEGGPPDAAPLGFEGAAGRGDEEQA